MLARRLEAAGVPTVVVTMMPDLAEALIAPRIVGVEFPFGHPFGMPHDPALQQRVLELAAVVLAGAAGPGTRVDLDVEWPFPVREAYRAWQPAEPSPIVAHLLEQARSARRTP
ncbi:MAG TPA: hypothetical protein VLV81_10770 [Acidimicrobiia bacterium]|nr:hypothetical protein [Acidimicrobiia bacterium]